MQCPVCLGVMEGATSTIRIMWDKKKVAEIFEITSHNSCSDQLYEEIKQLKIDDYNKESIIEKFNLNMGE